MGFLRFLSRKEKKAEDELDVPPPPPASMGMGSLDTDLNAPFPGDEISSELSFPQTQTKQPSAMGDFDFSMPKPEPKPAPPVQLQQMPKTVPRQIIPPEMPAPNAPEHFGKALYVEVEQFRDMVADLTKTRSDLKKMEQVVEHMLVTEAGRDKDYGRYRALLNDTQRKLVFIDKTLFKGDVP
jgi:hypothetical protein